MFGQPSERRSILCGELHNIAMSHRCLMGIKEDALHDLGRCEAELHVQMPFNINMPEAARAVRELNHL